MLISYSVSHTSCEFIYTIHYTVHCEYRHVDQNESQWSKYSASSVRHLDAFFVTVEPDSVRCFFLSVENSLHNLNFPVHTSKEFEFLVP